MSITYAGHPLLLGDIDGQLAAWIESFWDLGDLRAIADSNARQSNRTESRGSARVGIARPNYPPAPTPRLNSLYWPSGASRWAYGLFMADADTVDRINDSGDGAATLRLSDEGEDGDGPNSGTIAASMYLLPPRPISSPGWDVSLYLLPLVDERYFWQWKPVGELDVETWSDLFDELGEALGVSLSPGAIDSVYGIPDPAEVNGRHHDNAAVLLDAVAHSVGLRVVRQLDGTVSLQNADEAEALLENFTGMVAGGVNNGRFRSRWMPSAVSVSFPRWRSYHAECGGQRYLKTEDAANITGASSGVSSADKTIHTCAFADFTSGGGTPGNATAVDDLAEQIATDVLGWTAREYDFTVAGVLNWFMGGFDDHVLWLFGSQRVDVGEGGGYRYQAQTRVQSVPANFGVDEMLHQFAATPVVQSPARVTLTADLAPAGSAAAEFIDTGDSFTLFDGPAATGGSSGAAGWAVFVCEENHWEAVSSGGSSSPVFMGFTHATDMHAVAATQDVTLYLNSGTDVVPVYNPLMALPPQTKVAVAFCYDGSGGQLTIIGTNFTGLFGWSEGNYDKGETNGTVNLMMNESDDLEVQLTGVHFPFGGVNAEDYVSVTFNGWIWYAESKECSE